MKRDTLTSALLAISILGLARPCPADDLKAMEGSWKVESSEVNGQKFESDDLKDMEVKFNGDRYTFRIKDQLGAGSVALDEKQKPKTMDATNTEGDDIGKVTKLIYELTGDTLKLCVALNGSERPKEMITKLDSGLLLLTFTRVKKAE